MAKAENAGSKSDQSGTARALRGSSLIGLDVQDAQGSQVGSVKDIIVNPADGQISYAVVSLASSRGDAASFVVIPWSKFGAMVREDRAVVDGSQFSSAPQITQSELQRVGQDSWRSAADRYWDRTKTAQAEPQ
jgi:sporulation protein YlmC with PRC-barrel domain